MAAVALESLSQGVIPFDRLRQAARQAQTEARRMAELDINILAVSDKPSVVTTRVSIDPYSLAPFEPMQAGDGVRIAGVPEEATKVEVHTPLPQERKQLPTGQSSEELEVQWQGRRWAGRVSIVDAGLCNVLVQADDLPEDVEIRSAAVFQTSAAELDSCNRLHAFIEAVRAEAAKRVGIKYAIGSTSPKVVLVGRMPETGCPTSGGQRVAQTDADIAVRAVSVGNFHR